MNDTESDTTPNATPNAYLGFRIAVGVVGLVLIALFIMLGTVASKQSDTLQMLEIHESFQAAPAPAQPKGTP